MLGKKGAGLGWPVVVLIVATLFLFYPQISKLITPATEEAPTTPEETEAGYICPVETTTLGFSASDVDVPGTVVGVNSRLWVAGLPQGVVNSTSTATVSPGDKLQVWFAAGDATYYGSLFNDKSVVPCKGTYDIAGKLWTKDAAVTVTIYDQENDLAQTGAANNQTIGPGDTVQMRMRVRGNYHKYYGNPEITSMDNNLVVQYVKTELDSIKVTKDGADLTSVPVPIIESITTGNTAVGFSMPKIAGSNNVDYMLIIKADDIVNPTSNANVNIYDVDYFYNSITGKIDHGWEDQNNADIGETTEPTATIYLQ